MYYFNMKPTGKSFVLVSLIALACSVVVVFGTSALSSMSMDKAMDNLIKDDQQYYKGYLPPNIRGYQYNLETMFLTRNSIALIERIKELPQDEQRNKCELMFSKAFRAQTNAAFEVLRYRENPSNNPPNHQSFVATRQAICAAMFMAADCGKLDLLSNEFSQLDFFRSKFDSEAVARTSNLWSLSPTQNYLRPDNRFQVNVLRLAAVVSGNSNAVAKVDTECERANMKLRKIQINSWDARTMAFKSWNDQIDARTGMLELRTYDWDIGDYFDADKQEAVVSRLQSVVFE